MRPFFFAVEDTAGDVKGDDADNDDGEDDENRSIMMMILMTLTRIMTLNQKLTTRRK